MFEKFGWSVAMDRVRKEEVRRRAGIERELASRADQRVLRWFGHVEILVEYRLARRVLMAEVSGGRIRGTINSNKRDTARKRILVGLSHYWQKMMNDQVKPLL